MLAYEFFIDAAPNPFLKYVSHSPIQSLLAIIAAVCVFTRLLTGMQSAISQSQIDRPNKKVNSIPYWVPFVGSAVSFATDIQGTIARGRWVFKFPLMDLKQPLTVAETRQATALWLIGLVHHNIMSFICPRS